MVDLFQMAKKILKDKGKDSKLGPADVRDLILTGMADGVITPDEMRDLKDISWFHPQYMTDEAGIIFQNFILGIKGKPNKKDDPLNIVTTAKKRMAVKSGKKILNSVDVKDILFLSISDGKLSAKKLENLLLIREFIPDHIEPTAIKFVEFFIKSYHKRIYPNQQMHGNKKNRPVKSTYSTGKTHELSPDTYRQCGTCSGSGRVTCSSCYGMGGRSEQRTDYDYDGNPTFRSEWISCSSCSSGYSSCSSCGGTGSVFI